MNEIFSCSGNEIKNDLITMIFLLFKENKIFKYTTSINL